MVGGLSELDDLLDSFNPAPSFPLLKAPGDEKGAGGVFSQTFVECVRECWIAHPLSSMSMSHRCQVLPMVEAMVRRVAQRQYVHYVTRDTQSALASSHHRHNHYFPYLVRSSCLTPEMRALLPDLFRFLADACVSWPLDFMSSFDVVVEILIHIVAPWRSAFLEAKKSSMRRVRRGSSVQGDADQASLISRAASAMVGMMKMGFGWTEASTSELQQALGKNVKLLPVSEDFLNVSKSKYSGRALLHFGADHDSIYELNSNALSEFAAGASGTGSEWAHYVAEVLPFYSMLVTPCLRTMQYCDFRDDNQRMALFLVLQLFGDEKFKQLQFEAENLFFFGRERKKSTTASSSSSSAGIGAYRTTQHQLLGAEQEQRFLQASAARITRTTSKSVPGDFAAATAAAASSRGSAAAVAASSKRMAAVTAQVDGLFAYEETFVQLQRAVKQVMIPFFKCMESDFRSVFGGMSSQQVKARVNQGHIDEREMTAAMESYLWIESLAEHDYQLKSREVLAPGDVVDHFQTPAVTKASRAFAQQRQTQSRVAQLFCTSGAEFTSASTSTMSRGAASPKLGEVDELTASVFEVPAAAASELLDATSTASDTENEVPFPHLASAGGAAGASASGSMRSRGRRGCKKESPFSLGRSSRRTPVETGKTPFVQGRKHAKVKFARGGVAPARNWKLSDQVLAEEVDDEEDDKRLREQGQEEEEEEEYSPSGSRCTKRRRSGGRYRRRQFDVWLQPPTEFEVGVAYDCLYWLDSSVVFPLTAWLKPSLADWPSYCEQSPTHARMRLFCDARVLGWLLIGLLSFYLSPYYLFLRVFCPIFIAIQLAGRIYVYMN